MFENKKIIAIIPARGGSKGIPNKNIKEFYGIPLIGRTIKEAFKSNYIDRVVVSTDSEEIAAVSRSFGAEVPVLRPVELARDDSPSIDSVVHMLKFINAVNSYDFVLLLQPTSVFRSVCDIDSSIKFMFENDVNSLCSFSRVKHSPHWMVIKTEVGTYEPILDESQHYYQRQQLPVCFEYNGAIYINSIEDVLVNKRMENETTILFEMDEIKGLDLDTEMDWIYAELLMSRLEL